MEQSSNSNNVEVDDNYNDYESDSGIESGEASATTSLSSSVFSFTYSNGRRYHSDRFQKADYFLPNDESEQQRLDMYHHMFLLLKGGRLHCAPIERPQRVLDVGTGTGIWAIDFADEFPGTQVIGTDISPIQPVWVPDNVKFEIDDCEESWTFQDNLFDYIHLRSLSGSLQDWQRLFHQCYEKCAPGGWVEFQDYCLQVYLHDGTRLSGTKTGHPVATYVHHLSHASDVAGRPLNVAHKIKPYMEKAGFVDIVESQEVWPIGTWPKDKKLKEIGRWGRAGSEDSVLPFAIHMLTKQGWKVDDVKKLCDAVVESYKKQKYFFEAWFVYGRKPEKKKSEC